MTKEDNMNVFK